MKTILKFKKTVFITIISITAFSCSKNDNAVTETEEIKTILSNVISKEPSLSMVEKALKKTELINRFQTDEQFTFFAPTNEALTTFLTSKGYTIETVPNDFLRNVLLNHIVSGKKLISDLTTGYQKTLAFGSASTSSTLSLYINTASSVKLNGKSNVIIQNVMATNGVIHFVDTVIDLPSISDHLTANANFSELVAAYTNVFVIGPSQPEVVTILSGITSSTIFAPTNQAFSAFNTELINGSNTPNGWSGISMENRVNIVKYHIVSRNVPSLELIVSQSFRSLLSPQFFTIKSSSPLQIIDVSNRISKIIYTDIQCTNGTIHTIDKVLRPML
jgi:uncharacterized surface protein with fasciclin (FAS1) repeats